MKNADVEALLHTAVTDAVPDVLDSILSKCEEREGKVTKMKPAVTPISWMKPMLSAAAALVLIVGGALGANGYVQNSKTDSVVSLDVNPSIEIEANRKEEVLAVRGLNSDGEQVIARQQQEGDKLEGAQLDVAVSALVGTMVEDGYLSEVSNSVLVTVDNGNDKKSAALQQSLMVSVSTAMAEKGVEGAVMGQSVTDSEELKKEASELGVSKGKASLVAAISTQNPQYSTEDLAKLSINDLGLLLKDSEKKTESVNITGTPSSKKYVSAEAAIDEVCAEAKVSAGDTVGASAKIGLEDGKLVYDVSLTLDSKPVICAVDAITGKVIGWINTMLGGTGSDDDKDSSEKNDTSDNDNKDGTETTTPTPAPTTSPSTGTSTVGQVIDGTIDSVGSVVGGVVDGVGDVVGGTVDGVGSVVDSTIGGVGSVVDTTVGGVGSVIDSALTGGDVEGAAEDYADSVEGAAEKFVDDITGAAGDLTDKITGGNGSTGRTGDTGNTGSTGDTGGSIGGAIGSVVSGLFS